MKTSLPSRDQTPLFVLGVAALFGSLAVFLLGGTFETIAAGLTLLSGWYCYELLRSSKSLAASNRSLKAEIAERQLAVEAPRASEERFRLLAENSLDLIARLSTGGHFLDVSSAAEATLGYRAEELVGTHPSDYLHPEDKGGFWSALQELQRGPQRRVLTVRMRSKSGDYRSIEVSAHALTNSQGEPGGEIHCTLRDITLRREEERKRDQMTHGLRAIVDVGDELLRFSDERQLLRQGVEMARERLGLVRSAIFLASEDGTMVCGTFGTNAEGATVEEHQHHIHYQSHWRQCVFGPATNVRWRVLPNEPLEYYVDGVRRELANRGWIALTLLSSGQQDLGFLSYDPGESGEQFDPVQQELVGVFASMVGAMLARTRADAAKRALEKQLRTVMESAPVILYAVGNDERYFLATGRGLARLGYQPANLIGKKLDEVGSNPAVLESVRRALAGETNASLIQQGQAWIDMLWQPLWDDDGSPSGMIAVGIDVTEQHLAESARQESELQYRQVVDDASEVFVRLDAQ